MTRPAFAVVFPHARVTGGVERVALELVRYQSKLRDTRFVGVSIEPDELPHVRVTPRPVPAALRPLAFRRAASRTLAELKPATTLSFGANCPPGDVYWVQSVHAAWLANGGQVFVRGVEVPAAARRMLLRHQVLLRLEREYFTTGRPRAILCTSAREVEDLRRIYGVPREVMHVVPNGFDGASFSPSRRAALRASMRATLGCEPTDRVVLMVANEWHRKGLGPLLEAVAKLGDARIRLDLVGAKSPEEYQPMAQRLGLGDRMHWHGPSRDVALYYAAADAFVLPTTYEPFGIVIVEALATGLPVVTSRLAGASPAIDHGVSGYLLDEPRDPSEIAAALSSALAADDELRAAAAEAARPYEWGAVFDRVDGIIFPNS